MCVDVVGNDAILGDVYAVATINCAGCATVPVIRPGQGGEVYR